MDEFIPATGRVLRYWCSSLADRCRHQIYDYLGVQPVDAPAGRQVGESRQWSRSEIWRRPPGPAAPGIVTSDVADVMAQTIPRLRKRVQIKPMPEVSVPRRRRGSVLSTTFREVRKKRIAAGGIRIF